MALPEEFSEIDKENGITISCMGSVRDEERSGETIFIYKYSSNNMLAWFSILLSDKQSEKYGACIFEKRLFWQDENGFQNEGFSDWSGVLENFRKYLSVNGFYPLRKIEIDASRVFISI
ncbi:hypothetical protein [Nitrospirillum iridis]|uniref:Uncharacterized protein n=1 Tax=Nitrospirillum iridis TaxID=765888 RepID=A0A7X0EDE5_9PROT|nr:hypothetical protein [Nitrospirillum iridis]MBB6250289.1 hypothetical protein [Nitrospirillum iridis]